MGGGGGERRRQQAAETRDQILAAAADMFEERGYNGTTVGAITERANTAHGTFYLYFRNKEEVFGEVIAGIGVELYERAMAVGISVPPEQSAESTELAVRGLLDVFAEHRGAWRGLYEAVLQSPQLEAQWIELRHAFVDRLQERFVELQDAGVARDFDSEVVAYSLVSMVEWFAFARAAFNEPDRERLDTERAVAALTDLWNRAVLR